MVRKFIVAAACVGLLVGCTQAVEKRANIVKPPEIDPCAKYVGNDTCMGCHEEISKERHNVHLRIASFEAPGAKAIGCEGCHGPGSLHVDGGGDKTKILHFGEEGLHEEEVAAVCTTCHSSKEHLNWAGSAHAENEVTCTTCHTVHKNDRKALLAKGQNELCGTCHQDVMAQTYFASHHPIKEGKMGCTDCHNPHGGNNFGKAMLKTDERVNDLCLKCHTRYQGPFVFEHDPVVEDCMICHDPHGTVANNLLRQQEPFLCLQCHEAHFHAARASNSKFAVTAPGDPSSTIGATEYGFQKSFMTKCTQCHPYVHGSDLPSQSVAGQGQALTR